jgi:gamma-glutamylputrescine oxidase
MKWLFANEAQGVMPKSWYAATAEAPAPHTGLHGEHRADLCIIGAGYTGLSAALHAAKAGMSVIVLEAHRVGWGASGRNGGQVGTGLNWDVSVLDKAFGKQRADALWAMTEDAKKLTHAFITEHAPESDYTAGLLQAAVTAQKADELAREAELMRVRFGYDTTMCDAAQVETYIGTKAYAGAALDMDAGYCHPLRYAFGLARACNAAGVRIFERSAVHKIDVGMGSKPAGGPHIIRTDTGTVSAKFILQATNGYGAHLNRKTAARVLPINNYIAATEPLAERAPIKKPMAVYDSKFVLNYFWQSLDGRLIFGGGESYGKRFGEIEPRVRKHLSEIYPELSDVKFTHKWGGTLAVTATRLPFVDQVAEGHYSAGGYSGHGLVLATFAGRACVNAMRGDPDDFKILQSLPSPALPGGAVLGSLITNAAMRWMAFKDKLFH